MFCLFRISVHTPNNLDLENEGAKFIREMNVKYAGYWLTQCEYWTHMGWGGRRQKTRGPESVFRQGSLEGHSSYGEAVNILFFVLVLNYTA